VAKTMSKVIRERISNITQLFLFSLAALILWEAAVRLLKIPKYLLPTPLSVVVYMWEHPSYIAYHSWITLVETVLGFVGGAFLGILGGVGIHYSAWLRKTLYPVLIAFNTIPKVALAPLFLVWFGYGLLPKVLIALLIAFFPLVVNTVDGLNSVPRELLELGTIFRARLEGFDGHRRRRRRGGGIHRLEHRLGVHHRHGEHLGEPGLHVRLVRAAHGHRARALRAHGADPEAGHPVVGDVTIETCDGRGSKGGRSGKADRIHG